MYTKYSNDILFKNRLIYVISLKLQAADAQGGAGSAGKAEKAILRMSVIMVTCYLIAWTPYAIVCMMASYGPPNGVPIYAEVIPSLFAKSSMVYNPIIYVLMNKPVSINFFSIASVADSNHCHLYHLNKLSRLSYSPTICFHCSTERPSCYCCSEEEIRWKKQARRARMKQ